jgi:hypothetical protein
MKTKRKISRLHGFDISKPNNIMLHNTQNINLQRSHINNITEIIKIVVSTPNTLYFQLYCKNNWANILTTYGSAAKYYHTQLSQPTRSARRELGMPEGTK